MAQKENLPKKNTTTRRHFVNKNKSQNVTHARELVSNVLNLKKYDILMDVIRWYTNIYTARLAKSHWTTEFEWRTDWMTIRNSRREELDDEYQALKRFSFLVPIYILFYGNTFESKKTYVNVCPSIWVCDKSIKTRKQCLM